MRNRLLALLLAVVPAFLILGTLPEGVARAEPSTPELAVGGTETVVGCLLSTSCGASVLEPAPSVVYIFLSVDSTVLPATVSVSETSTTTVPQLAVEIAASVEATPVSGSPVEEIIYQVPVVAPSPVNETVAISVGFTSPSTDVVAIVDVPGATTASIDSSAVVASATPSIEESAVVSVSSPGDLLFLGAAVDGSTTFYPLLIAGAPDVVLEQDPLASTDSGIVAEEPMLATGLDQIAVLSSVPDPFAGVAFSVLPSPRVPNPVAQFLAAPSLGGVSSGYVLGGAGVSIGVVAGGVSFAVARIPLLLLGSVASLAIGFILVVATASVGGVW